MSKSLNLYLGAAAGIGVTFVAAINLAGGNVADIPDEPRMMAALPAAPAPEPEVTETAEAAAPVAEPAEADVAQSDVAKPEAAEQDTADAAPESEPAVESAADVAQVDVSEPQAEDSAVPEVTPAAAEAGETAGFGLGRPALPEEIAAWDVDIRPDGTGLPEGSGNAWDGEALFEENCASCHGSFAEGVDNWPKLAGGDGTLADEDPVKTVGSYWPYTSTVWDYVHRSMPFGGAQSLSDDDVYAIVAYILYSNDLIEDDFELTHENLASVTLPNADGFIVDDREQTEYPIWRTEPCMENCKESVEITMRATVLDVTPEEEGAMDPAAAPQPEVTEVADAGGSSDAVAAPEAVAEAPVVEAAALDADLVKAGERVFNKCKACHQVGEDAKNRAGPQLNGVVGREIGGLEGFKYSNALSGMGGVWDEEALAGFLADPRGYAKGTKMVFAGLRKDSDIAAITEFLKSHSQ